MFPTDLASFLELIRQHGPLAYGLMFGFASANALLQTLFAGYVAGSGALDPVTLFTICWAGSFTGDTVRFGVGRWLGKGWLARYPRLDRLVTGIARLAERNHVWMIMMHRYPHGIRSAAAFAYGVSALSWRTFLPLNLISAGIWAAVVVAAGYAFSRVSEKVMTDSASGIGLAMLLAFLGLAWLMSRRLEQAMQRG